MIALIIISPFLFLICYLLPLLGTFLSRDQPEKWIAFWILQTVFAWTLIPLVAHFFEEEVQMVFKILLSLVLILVLNRQFVQQMAYLGRSNTCGYPIHCGHLPGTKEKCWRTCVNFGKTIWTRIMIIESRRTY